MLPILAYIGPETIVPFLSAIAAVFGFFMMLGRNAITFVTQLICKPFSGATAAQESKETEK